MFFMPFLCPVGRAPPPTPCARWPTRRWPGTGGRCHPPTLHHLQVERQKTEEEERSRHASRQEEELKEWEEMKEKEAQDEMTKKEALQQEKEEKERRMKRRWVPTLTMILLHQVEAPHQLLQGHHRSCHGLLPPVTCHLPPGHLVQGTDEEKVLGPRVTYKPQKDKPVKETKVCLFA